MEWRIDTNICRLCFGEKVLATVELTPDGLWQWQVFIYRQGKVKLPAGMALTAAEGREAVERAMEEAGA